MSTGGATPKWPPILPHTWPTKDDTPNRHPHCPQHGPPKIRHCALHEERVVSRRCRFICKNNNEITTFRGEHSKTSLADSKIAQNGPRWPKMAPRWLQMAPRRLKLASIIKQVPPKETDSSFETHRLPQNASSDPPKEDQNRRNVLMNYPLMASYRGYLWLTGLDVASSITCFKSHEHGPKMIPRAQDEPKMAPKWPQEGLNRITGLSKMVLSHGRRVILLNWPVPISYFPVLFSRVLSKPKLASRWHQDDPEDAPR